MSDTILIIEDLLTDVDKSLQTLTLQPSLKELPYSCASKDWDTWSPMEKESELMHVRGRLLEAQRLKVRRSSRPLSKKAQEDYPGDLFWIESVVSYGGMA